MHRGTQAIGGSCIELSAQGGGRLVLDAGRPLDAPPDTRSLLPGSLDRSRPAAVIFSHSHLDHWGLIDELPKDWPVWAGETSAKLIDLSTRLFGGQIGRQIHSWPLRTSGFSLAGFHVTPLLTDHSAFDAYMLLIEGGGSRVLYSGDFRTHGRKSALVEKLMASPPADVDVLIMEGTNLQSGKPSMSESLVEEGFVEVARETPGRVFVYWSAQNIDRTVTLYRAAKRTGRDLVIDLYAADVLDIVSPGTAVPRADGSFKSLKVVITPSGKRLYARQGRTDFVDKIVRSSTATSRGRVAAAPSIIMLRDSMLNDFAAAGLGFGPDDVFIFSSWSGYLREDDPTSAWARARAAGAKTMMLHTSGHASPKDLERFAKAVNPRWLVPVHGLAWDNPGIDLPPVKRLADGERWTIS